MKIIPGTSFEFNCAEFTVQKEGLTKFEEWENYEKCVFRDFTCMADQFFDIDICQYGPEMPIRNHSFSD